MKTNSISRWEQIEKNPPKSYSQFFKKEYKFLEKNISSNFLVLDIGCGTGRIMEILSKISKKVIGIDNDISAVKKCETRSKKLNNVKIFLESVQKIHFKDDSFDAIVCLNLFENLSKLRNKALLEIRRVLKKEGILILSVYNEVALEERLKVYRKIETENFKVLDNGKVKFNDGLTSEQFSKEQIKEILDKTGFKIYDITKGKIYYLIKAKKK